MSKATLYETSQLSVTGVGVGATGVGVAATGVGLGALLVLASGSSGESAVLEQSSTLKMLFFESSGGGSLKAVASWSMAFFGNFDPSSLKYFSMAFALSSSSFIKSLITVDAFFMVSSN